MNILHITEDYSINSGGLRTVVKNLNIYLNNQENINSIVLSSGKEHQDNIYIVETAKGKPWLYSPDWKVKIDDIVKDKKVDLIHIHGVWMYPQFIAAKFAIKQKIPFIVTPHGMYEPWLWTKGRFKKKLYLNILTKRLFSKASRIHAITEGEKFNLKQIFSKSKVIEIPNLLSFDNINYDSKNHAEERYILFLGRFNEVKGINMLIKSFSELVIEGNNVVLKIAGGFNDYKLVLDKLVDDLGLKNKVEFLGMVKGEDKFKLYQDAFVFVAPSHSEVVGMVNLEAASQKTPVITTYQTGLKKEWNKKGGVLINPNQEELTFALKKVLSWSQEERDENGEKLYNFVKENYSWESKVKDWINCYSSVIEENR